MTIYHMTDFGEFVCLVNNGFSWFDPEEDRVDDEVEEHNFELRHWELAKTKLVENLVKLAFMESVNINDVVVTQN